MTPTCIFQHPTTDTQSNKKEMIQDAIGDPTSDHSLVTQWGRVYLVLFNISKTQYLQLSTQHHFPDNYLLFFNDSQLPLSSTLNTLGLSFTKNLNWQFHIFQEVWCPMTSASIFLSFPDACSVQGSYPPMYGVYFSCMGGFNPHNSFE